MSDLAKTVQVLESFDFNKILGKSFRAAVESIKAKDLSAYTFESTGKSTTGLTGAQPTDVIPDFMEQLMLANILLVNLENNEPSKASTSDYAILDKLKDVPIYNAGEPEKFNPRFPWIEPLKDKYYDSAILNVMTPLFFKYVGADNKMSTMLVAYILSYFATVKQSELQNEDTVKNVIAALETDYTVYMNVLSRVAWLLMANEYLSASDKSKFDDKNDRLNIFETYLDNIRNHMAVVVKHMASEYAKATIPATTRLTLTPGATLPTSGKYDISTTNYFGNFPAASTGKSAYADLPKHADLIRYNIPYFTTGELVTDTGFFSDEIVNNGMDVSVPGIFTSSTIPGSTSVDASEYNKLFETAIPFANPSVYESGAMISTKVGSTNVLEDVDALTAIMGDMANVADLSDDVIYLLALHLKTGFKDPNVDPAVNTDLITALNSVISNLSYVKTIVNAYTSDFNTRVVTSAPSKGFALADAGNQFVDEYSENVPFYSEFFELYDETGNKTTWNGTLAVNESKKLYPKTIVTGAPTGTPSTGGYPHYRNHYLQSRQNNGRNGRRSQRGGAPNALTLLLDANAAGLATGRITALWVGNATRITMADITANNNFIGQILNQFAAGQAGKPIGTIPANLGTLTIAGRPIQVITTAAPNAFDNTTLLAVGPRSSSLDYSSVWPNLRVQQNNQYVPYTNPNFKFPAAAERNTKWKKGTTNGYPEHSTDPTLNAQPAVCNINTDATKKVACENKVRACLNDVNNRNFKDVCLSFGDAELPDTPSESDIKSAVESFNPALAYVMLRNLGFGAYIREATSGPYRGLKLYFMQSVGEWLKAVHEAKALTDCAASGSNTCSLNPFAKYIGKKNLDDIVNTYKKLYGANTPKKFNIFNLLDILSNWVNAHPFILNGFLRTDANAGNTSANEPPADDDLMNYKFINPYKNASLNPYKGMSCNFERLKASILGQETQRQQTRAPQNFMPQFTNYQSDIMRSYQNELMKNNPFFQGFRGMRGGEDKLFGYKLFERIFQDLLQKNNLPRNTTISSKTGVRIQTALDNFKKAEEELTDELRKFYQRISLNQRMNGQADVLDMTDEEFANFKSLYPDLQDKNQTYNQYALTLLDLARSLSEHLSKRFDQQLAASSTTPGLRVPA